MSRQWSRAAGGFLLAGAWVFIDGFFVAPAWGPFCVMTVAGVVCLASSAHAPFRRPAGWIPQLALVQAAAVLVQLVLPSLMSRFHAIPAAADAAILGFRSLGLAAAKDSSGHLLLEGTGATKAFALTWEMFALPGVARLMGAAAIIAGASRRARAMAAIAGLAVVRIAVLVTLAAGGARPSIFYEPIVTLAFLLAAIVPMTSRSGERPRAGIACRRDRVAAALALAVGTASLAGWMHGHHLPGQRREGRILIDESKSDWEWTEPAFDHEQYGQKSLYNYNLWKSWIGLHFSTRVAARPVTDEDLARTDVLVIKTPTAPYEPRTIDRIERFVRSGGGLYLIGDHTNLFGMSTVLNAIASPYGIRFNHDDTFPLDHESRDMFIASSPGRHPINRHVAPYPFETSCTLDVPARAEAFMVGRRLASEPVDYGHVNFFGDIRLDTSETFGLFVQAAAVRHGAGRVVAFTDSTNFSNFSMLWPGRRRLTLNVLDWLNRSGRSGPAPWAALVLAALAAACLPVAGRVLARGPQVHAALILCPALGAFLAAAAAAETWTADSFGRVEAIGAIRTVAFDTGISDPGLDEASPILGRDAGRSWTAFNTFFINSARSGLWPHVAGDLSEALDREERIVLVNPSAGLGPEQASALSRFLARGGRLLIVDSIVNTGSTAGAIAGQFGLGVSRDTRDGRPVLRLESAPEAARLVTKSGATAAWRDIGAGRVILLIDSAVFSDAASGGVYSTPGEAQESIFRSQAEVFRLLS